MNVTEKEVARTLQCFAYGVPSKYTYSQWEHLSYFGEHIRYLNATTDGKVTLPQIANKIKRYQDNGIYICTVSNGVVDITGNSFQKGKICVIANGNTFEYNRIIDSSFGSLSLYFIYHFYLVSPIIS